MISVVIFDLDDTLYDEVEYCRSGFRAAALRVAERFGVAQDAAYAAMWQAFSAGNHSTTFNAALDTLGIAYDAAFIAALVQTYRTHAPSIRLPDETRRVLDELAGLYRLALLTDGFLPAQKLKVGALGIEKYFSAIVYTEELGRERWKPSPAGFQKIISLLQTEAAECAYVADNEEKDFIAPNRLGMVSVKISRPNGLHRATNNEPFARPQHAIANLFELPRLLQSL
jgi:putative hydrolase of the HAD superfamily